jgi:hypothetical protein
VIGYWVENGSAEAGNIISIPLQHIVNAFECFLSMSQDRLHKSETYYYPKIS